MLPDGTEVPHVTAILSALGLTVDFGEVASRGPRQHRNVLLAGERGTAVHADCHAYDDDDLDWDTVHHAVRPYVEAWAEARVALGLRPINRERRVYHPVHGYTGISDGLFELNGDTTVGDIKTGDPSAAATHLQTAAYAEAYRHENPTLNITRRVAIWLRPGLRVPYKLIDYTARPEAPLDFMKFAACVTVYRERLALGRL